MIGLTTRQQAARSGRARRLVDVSAQLRVLKGMGVQVAIEDLRGLPPGAWIQFVPDDEPLRLARFIRRR
jgi:hypothetical protein